MEESRLRQLDGGETKRLGDATRLSIGCGTWSDPPKPVADELLEEEDSNATVATAGLVPASLDFTSGTVRCVVVVGAVEETAASLLSCSSSRHRASAT
jgi:hypothetical protein